MTISTAQSQAVEELAYQYMPYLQEEAICEGHQSLRGDYHGRSFYCDGPCKETEIKLTLQGFHDHVLSNIKGFREDGTPNSSWIIEAASDAHTLGYYMDMEEGWLEIASSWETIVKEAQQLKEASDD